MGEIKSLVELLLKSQFRHFASECEVGSGVCESDLKVVESFSNI